MTRLPRLVLSSILITACSGRSEGPPRPSSFGRKTHEYLGERADSGSYSYPTRNFLPRHNRSLEREKGLHSQSTAGGSAATGNGIAAEDMHSSVRIGSKTSDGSEDSGRNRAK